MTKRMLIDATHEEEVRVVIADENRIHEFDISSSSKTQNKGNIYLAKITRVEPSLQAAFVEYGGDRQGFLPFSEIHPDYYQIPVADRKRLLEEVAAALADEDGDDDDFDDNGNGNGDNSHEAKDSNGEQEGGHKRRRRLRGGRNRRDRDNRDEKKSSSDKQDDAASTASTEAPVEATDASPNADGKVEADAKPATQEDVKTTEAATAEETSSEDADGKKKAAPKKRAPRAKKPTKKELAEAEKAEKEAASEEDGDNAKSSPRIMEASMPKDPVAVSDEVDEAESPLTEENGATSAESEEADHIEQLDEPEQNNVETLEDESEDNNNRRRRSTAFFKRYKIQEVIKRGQVILVQVIKEERGNKGASLSSYISLAGRYCVLMPNSPKAGGISRKIASGEDRKRLKQISEEIRSANGMSAIIRTAGIDRTRAEIKRDYDYLVKLWSQIREQTISSTAPAMVHEEGDIVKRSLRDLYTSDLKEVVVAGDESYKRAKEFMKIMMPSHAARIKLHNDTTPIFYSYEVEEQLLKMHEPQVKLPSGGSIVINPTEALVAIDVNSGRATTERNVEETALKTNLEAAIEVARQLRLRDLAGLIVVDFIDMFEYKNRRAVERQLKDALKSDRAKIQVGRISAFGLLEMSRQRMRPSLSETNMISCAHCEGRGFVLSPETLSIQLLRLLEKEGSSEEYRAFKLKVMLEVALHLLNTKRERLHEIEATHNIKISVEVAEHLVTPSSFILERVGLDGQKTEISGLDGVPALSKRARQRKRKRDKPEDRHSNGKNHHDYSNDDDYDDEDEGEEHIENNASEPAPQNGERGNDNHSNGDHHDNDRGGRRRRRRGGRGRNRDRDRERGPRNDQPRHDGNAPEVKPQEGAEPILAVPDSANAAQHEGADNPAQDKSERGPRRRGVRGGRRRRQDGGNRPQESQNDSAPASENPAPASSPAPQEKQAQQASSVPSSSSTRAADNDAGSKADSGEKAEGKRGGWWRRIVE